MKSVTVTHSQSTEDFEEFGSPHSNSERPMALDQQTTTPHNNKRLLSAMVLSILPMGALVIWGLSALDDGYKANPRGKQLARSKAPEKAKKPLRINLAGEQTPPPLPEKTQFSTVGSFFLTDV
ncbi:MAG: hypothetical protein P1V97_29820, partial [Planctomycetota bacterium]|nr:hypothetical protein [Planctomycetota bacterium]